MKKVIALITSICLMFCFSLTTFAESVSVTYDGIEYTDNGESVTITGFSGFNRGIITISNELNGLPVTDIGAEAFVGFKRPGGFILPDSVINIGDSAFENMYAGYFHLGNSVESIGDYVFRTTGVYCFRLPDSVVSIGIGAFNGCYALDNIVIPSGVREIKADTFKECPKLVKIIFLNSDTEIDPSAFDNPSDTNLVIYGHAGSKVEKFANDNGYSFKPYIPIKINGKEITPVNANSVPEVIDGKIFVPLRFIVESLNHTVDYDDENCEVWIDDGTYTHIIGTDYILRIGDSIMEPYFESKSYIENETAMVSTDLIELALGCDIVWDKENNAVEITAK